MMPWFKYVEYKWGHVPEITVRLSRHGKRKPCSFLVDTGASQSFVPRHLVLSLIEDTLGQKEQSSGAKSATGGGIDGIPLDFCIDIPSVAGFPQTSERIWVVGCGDWGLLGQTWLEKIGANFQNFPGGSEGRRFALYKNPL